MKNEPAFPNTVQYQNPQTGNLDFDYVPGMSKRFYAACAAMQGILHLDYFDPFQEVQKDLDSELAKRSFMVADAMLKYEREHPED